MKAGNVSILQKHMSTNITTWPLSGGLASRKVSIVQPLWLAAEMDAISGNSTEFCKLFARDLSGNTIGIIVVTACLGGFNRIRVEASEVDLIKTRLRDPFGIVHERFGDVSLAAGLKAQRMFNDSKDGIIQVRRPQEYGLGNSVILQMQQPNEVIIASH